MLFNSVIFITAFLPLALLGWFLLQKLENPAWAKAFLIGMSFWFYGYYNVSYLWILLVSLAGNYAFSFLLRRIRGGGFRRGLFVCGVLGNLGLLFYFKYFNFFIDNCNFLLHTDIRLEKIALPLGISFFTFQQMSFLIERYRGNAPHYPLLDYVFFVSFFPQLIAGPIVLHSELVPQLQGRQNRRFSPEGFYDGATLFILGLAKKVLLADSLAVLVNAEYDNIAMLDTPTAWIVIVWYMMELYFDFSGYCDMARGIAAMFGFRLPENFDSPFKAASVREFWRRWHMTLSRFLSQYVYLPLGGNRKGKRRQILNLLAVFLVSGLWHGADWTFVLWGLMHGLAAAFETAFPRARFRHEWMNRATTAVFVTLSFSVFRSDSLESAALLWRKLFTAGSQGKLLGVCNTLVFPENYALRKLLDMAAPGLTNGLFLSCFLLLTAVGAALLVGGKAEAWIEKKGHTLGGAFCLATLFTWAFLSLSQVSVFLYFNF
ncbi:MBOAT family protein [uncultured Acetatifactor sp.]|uniref:MBOAT family O-acyltransferase n=1 Tax=uncultured Acetatifactor sp. TaxID=1671927 RepID=UPI00261C5282|nr:MBOAT family O-acyltransferase [uncultured Acetatifactor sp.]